VGGSGSGKTTIALAILGLLPRSGHVTAGRIILEGKDLVTLGEREKEALRGKGVAYIPQEPMAALDPCFTVRSQLSEPLRTHHKLSRTVARARALELLELVGIAAPDTVARCYPHQLSGGMAQRVAIAVALTGEPRVLIADEPTTALDVTIQAEILDLLRDLRQRFNMTLLLVSHDLGVVADICDRVAVMSDGRLVEQGSAEDVLLNPQHDYTRLLIDCMPKLVAL
ncbi:MAG: ABC transporter ATP-binding protein, partial [Thermoleophilia bacterium]|nr:ABC transporter ATP-binding protein [Thermoleophilia bacterium]